MSETNRPLRERPRTSRKCAICQTVEVIKTRVCEDCMNKFGDQQDEPWFQFCLYESEETANLIRITRRKERDLTLADRNVVQ